MTPSRIAAHWGRPTPGPADSPLGELLLDPLGWLRRTGDHLHDLALTHGPRVVVMLACVIAAVGAARGLLSRWRHAQLERDARVVEILPPPRADLAGAEALWTQLLGLLRPSWSRLLTGQPHVVFEYRFDPSGIFIRLWVPGVVPPGLVERGIEAVWPGARTRTRPADTPLPAGSAACGGVLRLGRADHYPLRFDFDAEPLRGLLGAAAALEPGQHMVAQVAARPLTGRRLRRAYGYATRLRSGVQPSVKSRVFDLLTPGRSSYPASLHGTPLIRPETSGEVRAILDKAAKPRFAVVLRYAVATTDVSPDAKAWLRGRAHALAAAFTVFTGHNHLVRRRLPHPAKVIASRRFTGPGDVISVPELAALAHLPTDETVPGLARAPARPTPPPPSIPATGPAVRVLGDSDAGRRRPVAVSVADARHHLQLLGETGTGKTTELLNMQIGDADAGRGFVSMECKGDSHLLLSRLPQSAIGNVAVIDPDDHAPPPCLNILDTNRPELTADVIVGVFRRVYADFWGPRTDDVLRSACLTLAVKPGASLADIPRLLADNAYRRRHTARVTNPFLRDFWNWYDDLSPAARAQVVGPVMNKLRAVLLRGFARDVLAGGPSTLDIGHLLNTGGIVIARLPKGILGEDTARLLGSLILAKTWQAIQARAAVPEHQRVDCTVYIDEAHNFLTLPHGLDDMLAEARSHRACLVLAHQNLAQLPKDLRESISANARNKVFFHVSPEDARHLRHHVEPELTDHDLTHLAAFQAAARLVVNHAQAPAFTLRTRRLPPPVAGRATAIRQASRQRFGGRPRTNPSPPLASDDPRRRTA